MPGTVSTYRSARSGRRNAAGAALARELSKLAIKYGKKKFTEAMKKAGKRPRGRPKGKKGAKLGSSLVRFQGYGTMPKVKYAKPNTKLDSLTSPFGVVSHGKQKKDLYKQNQRFDQKCRLTIYYNESDCLNADNIITKREPILTNSSIDVDHAYNIVQELTWCPNAKITIGNQRLPVISGNVSPIYSTNGTGTALVPGLVHSDSTKFPAITCTALPRSAELESKAFQIPTHIWESCQIKLRFQNTCAQAQRIGLKVVRFKDTVGFNKSLTDGSMIGVTQGLCNHYKITDKQEYDTLWSYNALLQGLNPNRKQSTLNVNKTVFANYMRSTLHRNSSHTGDAEGKLGGQLLPQFKQTNESYNTCYLVISITQYDDQVVKFETSAVPPAGEDDCSKGWRSDVDPVIGSVTAGSNKVMIFGHVSNRFRFREVYSRTEAAQMAALQTSLEALHTHPEDAINLAGTWTNNLSAETLTVTAATTGQYDYTAVLSNNPTIVYNCTQDGETLEMNSQTTYLSHSYHIHTNGTLGGANSQIWTKS